MSALGERAIPCDVVELRRYTLRPCAREAVVELFETTSRYCRSARERSYSFGSVAFRMPWLRAITPLGSTCLKFSGIA